MHQIFHQKYNHHYYLREYVDHFWELWDHLGHRYREWRQRIFCGTSVWFWRRALWSVGTHWEFCEENGARLICLSFSPLRYVEPFVSFDPLRSIESFASWFVGGSLGSIRILVVRWDPLGLFMEKVKLVCHLFAICRY